MPPRRRCRAAAATYPFTFETLLEDAKRRAATPYSPQRSSLPAGLDKLSPEQYRSIRFNPDAGIWRAEQLPFRLELLRAGYNLQTAVTVSTVDRRHRARRGGDAGDVPDGSPRLPAQLGKVSLPLSGFRIRSRINSNKVWDEFLVFQGASYFRAVAKNLLYGLSARGLAINTGEPSGEEFPAFTHFWIERPAPARNAIVIYALLESESATGAYRFTVQPGVETLTDVDLTLFPRTEMRVVGIAPLTSMFLFDETNRGHLDDYRPEVHDSDGLQIAATVRRADISAAGESAQAAGIHLHHAAAAGLRAGAAIAAAKRFSGFRRAVRAAAQRLDRTPGRLGSGRGRTGRNSVGPREQRQHRGLSGARRSRWRRAIRRISPIASSGATSPPLPKGLGKVVATRSGASIDGKRRVFLLDFVGAGEKVDGLRLDLGASAGRISNATLMSNGALHGLRASFEIDPSDADLIELRLRIMRGDTARHRNLAVSMDLQLNSAAALETRTASGGMPPEAPLDMPAAGSELQAAAARQARRRRRGPVRALHPARGHRRA